MEAFVIGGGTSLAGFDFNKLKDKNTIVVNKAISHVPNPNFFITMDYTFLRKLKQNIGDVVNKTDTTKVFICNFSNPDLRHIGGYIKDIRCNIVYDLRHFDTIIKSKRTEGLGESFINFAHGENSGYCAFQFAVAMGFSPIYLLGIDLVVQRRKTNATHFHNGYNQQPVKFGLKLDKYSHYWKIGLKEAKKRKLKVYSCSAISRLNNYIPYKKINGLL